MKFHEWGVGVDPDESCWVESVKFNLSFLVVIRVFYEIGPPACEEVGKSKHKEYHNASPYFHFHISWLDFVLFPGVADFVPACLNSGSQIRTTAAEFEPFCEVVRKASQWCFHQEHVRVTNVQSIDYKLQHGTGLLFLTL